MSASIAYLVGFIGGCSVGAASADCLHLEYGDTAEDREDGRHHVDDGVVLVSACHRADAQQPSADNGWDGLGNLGGERDDVHESAGLGFPLRQDVEDERLVDGGKHADG